MTGLLGQRQKFPDVVAAQLCGGISNLEHNIYCFEIARNFVRAWEAKPYVLTCPAVVSSSRLKEAFLSDYDINRVMSYGYDSNIALLALGTFGLQSAVYRAGYLNEQEIAAMAVPLDIIKKKKTRIGVACGQSRVECICAAIRAEIVNVLIIDEVTAEYVIERLK